MRLQLTASHPAACSGVHLHQLAILMDLALTAVTFVAMTGFLFKTLMLIAPSWSSRTHVVSAVVSRCRAQLLESVFVVTPKAVSDWTVQPSSYLLIASGCSWADFAHCPSCGRRLVILRVLPVVIVSVVPLPASSAWSPPPCHAATACHPLAHSLAQHALSRAGAEAQQR